MIGKKKRLSMNSIAGLISALANKSNKTHTHSEYAPSSHTHSEYALSSHTHSEYALSSHTHSEYAPSSHTHSEYALSSHTHSWEDIENKPTNLATTQNITDAISGIKMSGRNLLRNTLKPNLQNWKHSDNTSIESEQLDVFGGTDAFRLRINNNDDFYFSTIANNVYAVKTRGKYTVSFYAKSSNPINMPVRVSGVLKSVDITSEWKKYDIIFDVKSPTSYKDLEFAGSHSLTGNMGLELYFSHIKLVKEHEDWSPAIEDVEEIKASCCKKITERLDFLEKLLKEKKILLKPRVETKNIGEFHGGYISLSGAIYSPTENPALQKINISDTKEYSSIELTGVYPSYYSFYLTDGAYTEQPRFSSFLILVQTQNGQFFHQENVVPADVINQPFEIAISFPKSRVENIFFVGIRPEFSVGTNYANGIRFENHENIITNYELFE